MSQRDNFYEIQNLEDRKKNSKFDIGDIIKSQISAERHSSIFIIVEKYKLKDKKGEFWVYDVFYPSTNFISKSTRLSDNNLFKFIKLS